MLYEIGKDLMQCQSRSELFDVIIFSIMGQIGVTSSSIIVPLKELSDRWVVFESRGVMLNSDELSFYPDNGIFKQIFERKDLVDVEEYKNDSDFKDEYYNYISIDARMLFPIIFDSNIRCVIVLGNKLSEEDYTHDEKEYLKELGDIAGRMYDLIEFREGEKIKNENLEGYIGFFNRLDGMITKLGRLPDAATIKVSIREEFESAGIVRYAIFMKDKSTGLFVPVVFDFGEDLIIKDDGLEFGTDSYFFQFISGLNGPFTIEDFSSNRMIIDVFPRAIVSRMETLIVSPFKIMGELIGFSMVIKMEQNELREKIEKKAYILSEYLIPYINIVNDLEQYHGKYIDNIEHIVGRIKKSLDHCSQMSIPLTLVLFSIKNFKRYNSLYGHDKSRVLIESFETMIKARLADTDFSVRYDRHKILTVLPGKDKKYAVILANSLCNEMTRSFSTKEAQLLMGYLTSEYPADAKDVQSLMDIID
jgi:diguanylate cyclase (GGDEF)-like protein